MGTMESIVRKTVYYYQRQIIKVSFQTLFVNPEHKKRKNYFSGSNSNRKIEESNKKGLESGPEQTDRGLLLKKVSRGSGCSISAPCWLRVWVSVGTGPWLASV